MATRSELLQYALSAAHVLARGGWPAAVSAPAVCRVSVREQGHEFLADAQSQPGHTGHCPQTLPEIWRTVARRATTLGSGPSVPGANPGLKLALARIFWRSEP